MKSQLIKIFCAPLKMWHSGVMYAHTFLESKVQTFNASEKRNMARAASITMLGLFVAEAAMAQVADGLAGMANTAANQGDSLKTSGGKLFAAAGFVGAGYGGWNWLRKGKEGDHSTIKGGQIAFPILAGAVLGATGYVLVKAGETVGIQAAEQGQIPR